MDNDEPIALASLSLTHVYYNPNDPISYLCAWLALMPQALCVAYVSLLWSTREVEVLLMFAGQMGCEALNFGLKRLVKQERPRQMNGKGYGMPSSHAQFLAFFSVTVALFLLVRHQPPVKEERGPHTPLPYWQRILVSIAALVIAGAVAASRVYLSYHTPLQVCVGVGAGVVSAVVWFAVTAWLRREGWVEWALSLQIARIGRWRDLVVEEDPIESGWRRWLERRDNANLRVNGVGDINGKKDR